MTVGWDEATNPQPFGSMPLIRATLLNLIKQKYPFGGIFVAAIQTMSLHAAELEIRSLFASDFSRNQTVSIRKK